MGLPTNQSVAVLEVLAQIRAQMETSTAHMAKIAGGIYNDVLEVSTLPIPTDGAIRYNWHTACGSIVVFNETSAAITVVADGGTSVAVPAQGVGVSQLKASSWKGIPIAGRSVTIYGTSGTGNVSIQAFTGMQGIVGGGKLV